MKVIYLAGGCFWGLEKLMQSIPGVVEAVNGYANGAEDITPTYERVCEGDTGYRETVKVVYKETEVRLKDILTAFFYVIDTTVRNQQGPDVGSQYQTGIYYTDDASKDQVTEMVQLEKQKPKAFYVEVKPLERFYDAEEYHQNYLDKHPGGYCHITTEEMEEAVKSVIKRNYEES